MGIKPTKIDKKAFAPLKPLDDAVAKSKATPADTKALDAARRELETAKKELGKAVQTTQIAFGKAIKAMPEVAKTGKPSSVPIPYPSFAKIEKETKKALDGSDKALKKMEKAQNKLVKVLDREIKALSSAAKSKGDEADTRQGLITSRNLSVDHFKSYSFQVKAEGKNVMRLMDLAKPPK